LRPDESVARGSCFITVKRVKREPGQPRFGREIGVKLWPDLQRLEREGKSLQQILDWLLQEHQIKTSKPTLSRLLGEIREAAPIEPVPPLEPASEEDELKIIRQLARDEMKGGDWKQRQGGASLLIRLRAEERASKEAERPKPVTAAADDAAPAVWTPPTFGVKETN
jgi:hypothetical protein